MTWDEVGYIRSSDYRKDVVLELEDGTKQPSQIANSAGKAISHVSRALKQLQERDLVQVLNPEAKKGRLYTLTDDGQAALEEIKSLDGLDDDPLNADHGGVFIDIDEDDAIERIQMQIVDDEGNEINAGSFEAKLDGIF